MKPLLLLPILLCSCSSLRYAGRVEYTGQHGTYAIESDGKRVTGVVRFFAENGYNIDPTYRRQK
jgi:hypothetical protein